MICKNCGANIDDDAKFCEECGSVIEKQSFCPGCGSSVKSGIKFCSNCGYNFDAKSVQQKEPTTPPTYDRDNGYYSNQQYNSNTALTVNSLSKKNYIIFLIGILVSGLFSVFGAVGSNVFLVMGFAMFIAITIIAIKKRNYKCIGIPSVVFSVLSSIALTIVIVLRFANKQYDSDDDYIQIISYCTIFLIALTIAVISTRTVRSKVAFGIAIMILVGTFSFCSYSDFNSIEWMNDCKEQILYEENHINDATDWGDLADQFDVFFSVSPYEKYETARKEVITFTIISGASGILLVLIYAYLLKKYIPEQVDIASKESKNKRKKQDIKLFVILGTIVIVLVVSFSSYYLVIKSKINNIGTSGSSIEWSCQNNILYISGEGSLKDFPEYFLGHFGLAAPWNNNYIATIPVTKEISFEKVVIEDGITGIGENAFEQLNIKEIEIPDSVRNIGDFAFGECKQLHVTIPKSVKSICSNSFMYVPEVRYQGTITEFIDCISGDKAIESYYIDNIICTDGAISGRYYSTYVKYNGTKSEWLEKTTGYDFRRVDSVQCSDGILEYYEGKLKND